MLQKNTAMFKDLSQYHFQGSRYSSARVAAMMRRQAGYKRCSRCEMTLPLEQFHRDSSRKDGVFSWCSECSAAQREQRRAQRRATDRARYHRQTAAKREIVAEGRPIDGAYPANG